MERTKSLETSLVLTTGFLLIYFITKNELFLYFSFAFGITGIFIKPLANYIAVAWFKLAEILNYFVSRIVLGTLFFVVLLPISLLFRIVNKDKLKLRRSEDSNWVETNHSYSPSDLENIW